MKMLDEVITELKTIYDRYEAEGCFYCSFQRECVGSYCYLFDALHYLKEYQTMQYGYIKAMADLEDNPQLTWQELRQMEGKPVWVEQCNGDTKRWLLILRTNYDVITCTTKHGNSFYLYKSSYGEKWQAYRKERS